MSRYNRLKKIYPDGTVQTKLYDTSIHYNEGEKFRYSGNMIERQIDIEDEITRQQLPKQSERDKAKENKSRAVQKVYDYAKCNDFTWFCTFTLDPKICDSFDYDIASKELAKFRKWLSREQIQYIFVPEQHKSGAWHFHGLLADGLQLKQAVNAKTGEVIPEVYNILNYHSGFTTATKIKDKNRINTYITKYLTKEMSVPSGRKRYWCSTGLSLPKEVKDYINPESVEFINELHGNDFFKKVVSEYGTVYICEKRAADK